MFPNLDLNIAGLDYDSIYDVSRSQRSNASVVSDLESVYSRSTALTSAERAERARAKQRKLDVAPQFTSGQLMLRDVRIVTVRFYAILLYVCVLRLDMQFSHW